MKCIFMLFTLLYTCILYFCIDFILNKIVVFYFSKIIIALFMNEYEFVYFLIRLMTTCRIRLSLFACY